jgi:ribonuclease Z
MRVHCLGTTGYHPSQRRHTACYYLPDQALVLDAGTGMFRLIECLLHEPKRSIDILISHAHLDHVVGLTFLIDALAVTKLERVRLFGAPAKLEAVRRHLFSELIFPVDPPMEFVPLNAAAGKLSLEGVERTRSPQAVGKVGDDAAVASSVEWFPLEHPGGSLGFIISCPAAGQTKRVAYITDTTARVDADYVRHLSEIDLLLHECYFDDQQQALAEKTGHSWLSAVTEVVRCTQPKRTALIHLNPLNELLDRELVLSAAQVDRLQMRVPEDGETLEV